MATPIDDDTLQRFYDGDLSPLEEHSVQARVEGDPALQRRLAQLSEMTALMREAAKQLGESANSEALFAAIEGKLTPAESPRLGARLRLVASEWAEHRRGTLVPVLAAAAAAAAVLLVARPAEYRPEHASSAAEQREPIAAGGELVGVEPTVTVHGSRVEAVDFGASTGTVFEIEDQGVAVAVVWITDEPDELQEEGSP